MKTLKKGSKGKDVELLQKLLKISVDGDFGSKTEAAVKAYQSAHGLVADGIVGAKTWVALGEKETSSTSSKCVDPSVTYNPLTSCITRAKNRAIKYLAIHYTAGSSSAAGRAMAMKSSWEKTKNASADFGVDDRDMVQFNPDLRNYCCWAVGSKNGRGALWGKATNYNTISIEICSNLKNGATAAIPNHEGWYFTEESLANAVKLAKMLMREFNIPIERVVRHYDVTGKLCPGVLGWNDGQLYDIKGNKIKGNNTSEKWLEFKKRLK